MSQHSTAQSRQPTSYPSPHSYPSPSMSAYAYPPPTSGQNVEPYRASPTGSHISLPSVNTLPPIRNIDTRSPSQSHQQNHQASSASQPAQHQMSGQNSMGSPLPPPMTQMTQYYHNQAQSLPPPAQHMNVTSDPNQPVRYPLPAADNRMMSGGRHKKEIKRRTKTGCLTCRKRRIKVQHSPSGTQQLRWYFVVLRLRCFRWNVVVSFSIYRDPKSFAVGYLRPIKRDAVASSFTLAICETLYTTPLIFKY